MLLLCSSCNSRYLVNSADLKPKGRTVRCATCGYEWFQESNLIEEETLKSSFSRNFTKENNKLKKEKTITSNLPTTYIKEESPSALNTTLTILILIIIFFVIWLIKSKQIGVIPLLSFYTQELYFNLKLIINDLAKLIHQIIN